MQVLILSDPSSIAPSHSTLTSTLYFQFQTARFAVAEASTNLITLPPLEHISLVSGTLALLRNGRRVARWAKMHRPILYLSFGGAAATLAHLARRATGGYGMSVVYLAVLPSATAWSIGAWLERRAILHCDRILVPSANMAHSLVKHYHARGGDIHIAPLEDPPSIAHKTIAFLNEPPGWVL